MGTQSGEPTHGADDDSQPQGEEVRPTDGATGGSQPAQGLEEQITRAITPAMEELRDRMARVVPEDREQEVQHSPSETEEREPAPQAETQSVQGSDTEHRDTEQRDRSEREMRPDTSRPHDDAQGDNTMSTENPQYAARAGLLRMARQWRDTGSLHQAIEAYKEILTNYPGTQVASAAVRELTELAQMMENQGQFHSALEVFKMLEQFGVEK